MERFLPTKAAPEETQIILCSHITLTGMEIRQNKEMWAHYDTFRIICHVCAVIHTIEYEIDN